MQQRTLSAPEATIAFTARQLLFAIAVLPLALAAAAQPHPCAPLPAQHDRIVHLTPEQDLAAILRNAQPATTFLLADGTYRVSRNCVITTPDITVRSASGARDNVIIDGNNGGLPLNRSSFTPETIVIRASDVTLADLTIRYARDHGIHISGAPDHTIHNVVMHNIRVYDCGQQLIKVNSNGNPDNLTFADSGRLECSLIEFVDNSVMQYVASGDYYYTGGLDVHAGDGWVVRSNTFRNINNRGKLMEHAVHMWSKSRRTLIENNRFENVYRAIGLGMKVTETGPLERHYHDGRGTDPYFDHIGGMVRNNTVWNEAGIRLESGIELMNVIDVEVYHNTIVSLSPPYSSIEYRWPNTHVVLKNNLCSHRIMARNGAQALTASNHQNAPLSFFVDAAIGNLHLHPNAEVRHQGVVLPEGKAGVDMDCELRGAQPDIGADEVDGLPLHTDNSPPGPLPPARTQNYQTVGRFQFNGREQQWYSLARTPCTTCPGFPGR